MAINMPNKWSQKFPSLNLYVCINAIYLAPYALRPVEGATLDLDVGQCPFECLPHRDLKVQHSLLDSRWTRQKTLNVKKWNVINDQYGLACLVFSRLQLQYHNYVNLHIEWHNMASQSDCRAASQSDCRSNAKSLLPEDVDIRIVVMKMSVCIIINYKMTQLITRFNY